MISSCLQRTGRKKLSSADLKTLMLEFELPPEKTFVLDEKFINYLFSLDTTKYGDEIKNHYQPIQASYYDKTGHLLSFHINCYAGIGVKDGDDLNWNQRNVFSTFVPKTVAPLDTILTLSNHLRFIKTFGNKPIDTTGFSKYDYTIIVHWFTTSRKRDSKNLCDLVKKNSLLAVSQKVNILYVNDDNSW